MTGLEAIAEKLEQSKTQLLQDILSVSGSSVMSKNDYNVTVVDNNNPATSLVFKGLTKDKYDEGELIKAVDTVVKELAPNIPTPNLDLVPKPIYDTEVTSSNNLRKENTRLQLVIDGLNTTIIGLQAQVQTEINNRLTIEQTNDALTNQLDIVNGTITDFTNQISTSLQKSVDESILRASLQAQNTGFKAQIRALIKQIDSLNSIIEGLQAQLGALQQQQAITNSAQSIAGASGSDIINEVGLVKFTDKGNDNDGWLLGAISTSGSGMKLWKYGEFMRFTNTDKFPITINITATFDSKGRWFNIPTSQITLNPGEAKDVQNVITPNTVSYGKNDNSSAHYGTINISVVRKDGSTKSKDYKTKLNLSHWKSFPGW